MNKGMAVIPGGRPARRRDRRAGQPVREALGSVGREKVLGYSAGYRSRRAALNAVVGWSPVRLQPSSGLRGLGMGIATPMPEGLFFSCVEETSPQGEETQR